MTMLEKFIRIYNIVIIVLVCFFAGCAIGFFYTGTPYKGWCSIFFLIIILFMWWVTNSLVKRNLPKKKK